MKNIFAYIMMAIFLPIFMYIGVAAFENEIVPDSELTNYGNFSSLLIIPTHFTLPIAIFALLIAFVMAVYTATKRR